MHTLRFVAAAETRVELPVVPGTGTPRFSLSPTNRFYSTPPPPFVSPSTPTYLVLLGTVLRRTYRILVFDETNIAQVFCVYSRQYIESNHLWKQYHQASAQKWGDSNYGFSRLPVNYSAHDCQFLKGKQQKKLIFLEWAKYRFIASKAITDTGWTSYQTYFTCRTYTRHIHCQNCG